MSVGFYKEENYLMIQQSLEDFNEQDSALGMNNYHIERDDQSYGDYGGVKQIKLSRKEIKIDLEETGKENLDCEGVKIDFQTDDETFTLPAEKLKQFFAGNLVVK